MGVSGVWSRSGQRLGHVALATVLGAYLYSPFGEAPAVELAMQAVVFPALVLSGLLMWKGHRVRRWFGD
jgi:hypothetical protein